MMHELSDVDKEIYACLDPENLSSFFVKQVHWFEFLQNFAKIIPISFGSMDRK